MLTGLWRSVGYGWILEFDAAGYTLYHATALNCIAGERGSHDDFLHCYDRVELENSHTLSLHHSADITRYRFRRIDRLPDVPVHPSTGRDTDPVSNFDTLWQQFHEHYAFFALHGIDWDAIRERERRAAAGVSTATELFEVFRRMLGPLDDGHVTLAAPGLFHQRRRRVDLRREMQVAFGTPDGRITPRASKDAIAARIDEALLAPFAGRGPLKRACNDILSWCELRSGIGYLSVLRLFGYADTEAARSADDLPHERRDVGQFLRDDLAALDAALDAAVRDLGHCRGLVLDLRFNGGGFDRLGLAIAGRFADRSRLAFTKHAKAGDGQTPEQELHVSPHALRFTAPVVVLTSPLCVSAGEVLTLAMRALPHATIMGQDTAGMLSDNLHKPLPNGWELSLSNETYTSSDRRVFEGRGITPDVPVVSMDAAQFVPALQASLTSAVNLIESGGHCAPRHRRPE